ncbi:hypothetical protein GEMRC1_000433 [Eukaryota sp. GEM-RC1]
MYFFTSVAPDGVSYTLYSGKDKMENEALIRYAWDCDWWFHVDSLSSAHLYLRLPDGMSIDDVPSEVITDICQLTKANSIQGCKQNNVRIVCTPASNLLKTSHMVAGQVSFKDRNLCRYYTVQQKDNSVLNRLNKTRTEEFPDLEKLKTERESLLARRRRHEQQEFRRKQQEELERKREEDELKSYSSLMSSDNKVSNKYLEGKTLEEVEDDFM